MEPSASPLSILELQALRQKAEQGTLTPEDAKRFIEATRASFLARPQPPAPKPKSKKRLPKPPKQDSFDFF